MLRFFKLVAVNSLVFLIVFFGLMFFVSLGGDVVKLIKPLFQDGDKKGRHELIVFIDKEHAKQVFADGKKAVEGYAPIVGWRRLPMETQTVNISEDGLRIHQVGRGNEPGSPSIGFFGGSTVWGTGVDDDSTIPATFDEITDDFEVVNFGEAGWTSRQSLAQLINLINQGEAPDIVVFYSGVNDVTILCNLHYGKGFNAHHEAPKLRRLVLESQSRSYLYRNFVVPAVDTLKRVTGWGKLERIHACDKDPERAATVARTLFSNWQMAQTLVASYGGRFFAFLQPVAGFGSPKIDYLDLDPANLAQYPPVYNEMQILIAESGEGWVWDISDSFDGDRPLYMDSAHVIRAGNALAATRIRDTLARVRASEGK
jgi:hypothetical protein